MAHPALSSARPGRCVLALMIALALLLAACGQESPAGEVAATSAASADEDRSAHDNGDHGDDESDHGDDGDGHEQPDADDVDLPSDALAFEAALIGGGALDGGDLQGRDVAIWFYMPGCGDCIREAPEVAQAVRQYDDVTIIGVPIEKGAEDFIDEFDLHHFTHLENAHREVSRHFGVSFAPAWVFIDGRTGEAEVHAGALGADGLRGRLASG